MKHYLTDADKLELKSKLRDQFSDRAVPFPNEIFQENVLNGLVEFFAEFYASKNTFTDAIRDAQKPRIWKVLFRREWVQCIDVMVTIGKPMTTVEVARALIERGADPLKAREAARHLVDARHWNMIERTEERVGNAYRYRITSIGLSAFRKPYATLIKRFVYTMHGKVTPTPDGKEDPDVVSFGGVFYVEKRTKEEHVRDSASLDEQKNPSAFVS